MTRAKEQNRYRATNIAGDEEGLAAATAEIFCPAIAALARFRHPLFSAKALECRGFSPYPLERALANIVELHSWHDASAMPKQRLSGTIVQQQPPSPSPHAFPG